MHGSAVVALAALALGGAAPATEAATGPCLRVYVGSQLAGTGQGISAATFDTATGALSSPRLAAEVARPTWLLAEPRTGRLYATSDPRQADAGPRIVAYVIDARSGDLRPLGDVRAPGSGPTHLALDARSQTLFVAHYGSGEVAALPLAANGSVGEAVSTRANQGTGPSPRQTVPHAHAAVVDPSGRFVLVPDLGADRVFVYRFDPRTRQLAPAATPYLQLPAGSGPRHLVFARDGRRAYLLSELSGEVRTLAWDARSGKLTVAQTLPLDLPGAAGPRSAAEIALSANGRAVYASNRGDDTVVTFRVDRRTGLLSLAGRVAAGGKAPWAFALAPGGRWMLVANQQSDTVAVLPVDPATSLPGASTGTLPFAKPVTVTFAGATACR